MSPTTRERSLTSDGLSDLAVTALAASAMLAYPIGFALLYGLLGAQTFPFAIVPVGIAAWRFGARAGILAVAVQVAASTVVLNAYGIHGWAGLVVEGQAPVSVVLVATAFSIGFLSDLRDDLTQRAREAEALADATRVLVERTASHDTLQGILAAAMRVVPSTVAAFVVPAGHGSTMRVAALTNGHQAFLGRTYPSTDGISGRALRTGQLQRVDDVRNDPDYIVWTPDTRSALAIPVLRHGETTGILYLEDTARARYADRDVRLMRAFADHAAIALETDEREHALSAATDRFAAAFHVVPSPMLINSVPEGRIVEANDAFLRLTGLRRAEVTGKTTAELGILSAEDRARVNERLVREGIARDVEVTAHYPGGGRRILEISGNLVEIGGVTHFVSSATDVTERKRAARELEQLALYDSLTGLPNRNAFSRTLEAALSGAAQGGRSVAVLLLGLDRFKDVNDTFGHEAGDAVLREVGARMRAELQRSDALARLSGDEFAIVLKADSRTALHIAEQIRRALEVPFEIEGHAVDMSGSFGIAFFPEHGDTSSALIQHADIALDIAKSSGSGTTVYATALDAHSPARLALTAELRKAIGAGELALVYQPIVALRDGRSTGIEALARWPHPSRGLVAPADFIPLAERSGLIKPMTDWVLDLAIRRSLAWYAGGEPLEIAVNISMRNLLDPQLADTVSRRIAEHGIAPSRLCLEITESVAMADPDHTLTVLRRLREIGVRIAIDDFGTGYSSLSHLGRLPVDALKIDRSFVAGLGRDVASSSIVKATIELGHVLGLVVIAEGVEEERQLLTLRALGCDRAQGYFIARPMAEAAVAPWFAAHPQTPFESA